MNTVPEIEAGAKQRMEKALTDLQHAMAAIRTGRASIHLLDNIRVDYYGTPTPLNQVANLHVPEPGMITVQPWDASLLGAIEKVIRTSDLGINPANDGKIIRLPIPPLTQERRNIRRDSNEHIKKLAKDKKISEDDDRKGQDEMQKLTDSYMKRLDESAKTKEKEILDIK